MNAGLKTFFSSILTFFFWKILMSRKNNLILISSLLVDYQRKFFGLNIKFKTIKVCSLLIKQLRGKTIFIYQKITVNTQVVCNIVVSSCYLVRKKKITCIYIYMNYARRRIWSVSIDSLTGECLVSRYNFCFWPKCRYRDQPNFTLIFLFTAARDYTLSMWPYTLIRLYLVVFFTFFEISILWKVLHWVRLLTTWGTTSFCWNDNSGNLEYAKTICANNF